MVVPSEGATSASFPMSQGAAENAGSRPASSLQQPEDDDDDDDERRLNPASSEKCERCGWRLPWMMGWGC